MCKEAKQLLDILAYLALGTLIIILLFMGYRELTKVDPRECADARYVMYYANGWSDLHGILALYPQCKAAMIRAVANTVKKHKDATAKLIGEEKAK